MPNEDACRLLTRREALRIASLCAAGALLAACGGGGAKQGGAPAPTKQAGEDFSARFFGLAAAEEPNGDLSKVEWPEFVTAADPEVRRLYEFQITHGELMRYMPCFCGCGGDGHKSNRDCYVRAVNPDGSVVLDSMAPT